MLPPAIQRIAQTRLPGQRRHFRSKRSGFTLVEVVLALGIVSIAFLPLLGLLPTGLSAFRESKDKMAIGQIMQKLGNETLQSDFDTISTSTTLRFFDDQGLELAATDRPRATYHARLLVVTQSGSNHLKRVIVQVMRNPGDAVVPQEQNQGAGVLWVEGNTLPVTTRCFLLARSSSITRS